MSFTRRNSHFEIAEKLDGVNVEQKISDYLESVNSIKLPAPHSDVLKFINSLKREPLSSGPYPDVSLFEVSNRILSDMVILFGVRLLLTNPSVSHVQLPFTEYEVKLGVEGGNDLKAIAGSCSLVGEAFNVARSFFQSKKSSTEKKLQSLKDAHYRLIIFNADAVKNPDYYIEKSEPSMLYLPVNIWVERNHFKSRVAVDG
jgi:hypothetical protein